MVCCTSFLSSVTSWHLFRLARTSAHGIYFLPEFSSEFIDILTFHLHFYFQRILYTSCLLLANVEETVDTPWLVLTHSHCARCRDKGKGKYACVENPQSSDCQICKSFTPEQRQQLATPSHKIKKEKREARKLDSSPSKDSETLVDPANMSVIAPVDSQGPVKSPASVASPDKKAKKDKPSSTSSKPSKAQNQANTELKIAELDQKWSDRFNRLEALLMARSLEPAFTSNVKVKLTHSPPASVENVSEPFIRPSTELPGSGSSAAKHQPTSKAKTSRPTSATKFPGTSSSAVKHQPTSQTQTSRPTSSSKFPGSGSSAAKHQLTSQTSSSQPTPALHSGTDPSTTTSKLDSHRPHIDRPSAADRPLSSDPTDTGSSNLHRSRRDRISCLSSNAGSDLADRPPLDLYTEEGELSNDQDQTVTDQDQPVSEEQNYIDTMQGIPSFMGWSHIPDIDSTATTSEDNPFAGPKTVAPGKVSVKMPTEEWLCRKLGKLNLTLVEGYP